MRNKSVIMIMTMVLLGVLFISSVSWADSKTYTPPSKKGYVYTVINFQKKYGLPKKSSAFVVWGNWKKNGSISPGSTSYAATMKGFVIRLTHKKADSWPLTVTTTGTIVKGPYQGNPPSEWDSSKYKRVKW